MWDRVTTADRDYIKDLAGKDSSTREDRARLAAILNELVDATDLHRSDAFQSIDTFDDGVTEEGVEKLRKERQEQEDDFPQAEARRLNRLLIAAYLFDYVRPPRVNVVELPTWRPVERKGLQALRAEEAFMI